MVCPGLSRRGRTHRNAPRLIRYRDPMENRPLRICDLVDCRTERVRKVEAILGAVECDAEGIAEAEIDFLGWTRGPGRINEHRGSQLIRKNQVPIFVDCKAPNGVHSDAGISAGGSAGRKLLNSAIMGPVLDVVV